MRSVKALAVAAVLSFTVFEAAAQEHLIVRGNDTLCYTYTPLPQPLRPDTIPPKKGFLRRMVNYFERATEDHTFEKKIDFTFAGGISYTKDTNVNFAVLAAGLYRLDRTDSLTQPSNITLSGSVSVIGYYSIGATGYNLWRHNRQRLYYTIDFSSSPCYFWGLGYEAARHNPRQEFIEKTLRIECNYQQKLFRNTYAGVLWDFQRTHGKDFDDLSYLRSQRQTYTATGLGVIVEYDSRDVHTLPQKGIYLSLKETLFAKGLGSCPKSLWRTNLTADFFQRVWHGAILAADLYGEFNSEGTPWPMLARLGGSNRMRGYYRGRYIDNNLLTFQVELRQHIWQRLGGVVWAGAGNSFHSIDRFKWAHTLPTYGVGLRWMFKKGINVRMDYGFGKNTGGFIFGINEAF